MKTTTIFTGHQLDLTSIQAVGPVLIEASVDEFMATRTLKLTLTLLFGGVLHHTGRSQTLMGKATTGEDADWNAAIDELETARVRLIEQWERAMTNEKADSFHY